MKRIRKTSKTIKMANSTSSETAGIPATNLKQRITRAQYFFGEPQKDTVSVDEFFVNFEETLRLANLEEDGAEKIKKILPYLRDTALNLYDECWDWKLIPDGDYEAFKNLFRERFRGKPRASNQPVTFGKMIQEAGEPVMTFYNRVRTEAGPWAGAIPCQEGIQISIHQQLTKTLFVSGLRRSIGNIIQRLRPETIQDALAAALKLEETEVGKNRIQDLAEMDDYELNKLTDEELTEEDVTLVNQIRARSGKQPFRKRLNRSDSNQKHNGRRSFQGNCLFCGQKGHLQRWCHVRLSRGSPMITTRRRINDTYFRVEDDDNVARIDTIHLNKDLN